MTTKTQGARAVEFLLSEANGTYSRQNGTLRIGNDLAAGTVIMDSGSTDANGDKIVTAWTDGDAVGVLLEGIDATLASTQCAYIARAAEVKWVELTFASQTAVTDAEVKAALAAIGIITR